VEEDLRVLAIIASLIGYAVRLRQESARTLHTNVFKPFHLWFGKYILSIPAVSFDMLRTNGWDAPSMSY